MHTFLQTYAVVLSWSCIHYLFYQQVLIVLEDVITLGINGKKEISLKTETSEAKCKQKIIATLITLIVILFRLNFFPPFLAQQMNSLNSKVGKYLISSVSCIQGHVSHAAA